MNNDHKSAFNDLFKVIYKDDEDAIRISLLLVEVADIWDDLVDRDKDVPSSLIDKAFVSALFELQRYPLWFNAGLQHHVLNVYLRWRDATAIETDSNATDDDLNKCYMLRAGLYDIFVVIAYHLFGDDYAREVGPVVRRFYGETLKDYKEEMRNA